MTIPNIITVGRILLVPVIVYFIMTRAFEAAFAIFLIAGVSDAVDGIIARHFRQNSNLGAYLDPIADKALLVSIYVTLSIVQEIPLWLVLAVASRDILIVGGVLLSWMLDNPVPMKPLMISKVNTAAQIAFAALVLANLAFDWFPREGLTVPAVGVAGLTIVSAMAYLRAWVGHMSAPEEG